MTINKSFIACVLSTLILFAAAVPVSASDTLYLTGGPYEKITYTFTSADSGSIEFTNPNTVINIVNIEKIIDECIATNRVFNFPVTGDNIALSDICKKAAEIGVVGQTAVH